MTWDRRELAAIYAGGMLGALARVAISRTWTVGAGQWPWPTLVINISGAFLLGYLTARWRRDSRPAGYRRPLLATGFCGAFTTFSAIQLETVQMLDRDRLVMAGAYVALSVAGGIVAVTLAARFARRGPLEMTETSA